MIKNAVLDCIHERRSTRSFEDRPVERDMLETLLDAAVWAPSGSNSQSWLFTAITNRDALLRLNAAVKEGFARWTPDDDYPAKHSAKHNAQREGYNFYYNAPALIIASNRPHYANAMADCALALGNIFLAAQSLGLGSCYINQLRWLNGEAGVRDYLFGLGIPREHVVCGAAAVGYIKDASAAPARRDGTINIID